MSDKSKGRDQTKNTHWSSRLGVRILLTTQFYNTKPVTETARTVSEDILVWEESSLVELMTRAGESPREASAPTTLLSTKAKTRIGTWNIKTLCGSPKADLAKEHWS